MLRVNSLAGFGAGGADRWQTVLEQNNNGSEYIGAVTVRQKFVTADLDDLVDIGDGGNKVRLTISGGPSTATDIDEMYIGYSGSTTSISFAATPTRMYLDGVGDFQMAVDEEITLDEADFTWDSTKPLIVSWYISNATDRGLCTSSNAVSDTDTLWAWKSGNDASTETVSGYTLGGSAFMMVIKIEFANIF